MLLDQKDVIVVDLKDLVYQSVDIVRTLRILVDSLGNFEVQL
jgi:hypothetical protein